MMNGQPNEAIPKQPRNIVLLSDGTGNIAGKLSKTNVWRLYQALDLTTPPWTLIHTVIEGIRQSQ